jgi:hypothetical protein
MSHCADVRVALALDYDGLRLQHCVLTARWYVTFQAKSFQVSRLRACTQTGPPFDMAYSWFFGPAQPGAKCPKNMVLGRLYMSASGSGARRKSSSNYGRSACANMNRSTESSGNGRAMTADMRSHRWGGTENGPNPADRAKPGMKDHLLVDE